MTLSYHVKMKGKGFRDFLGLVNRVNRMHAVWVDEDNVPCLAIEKIIIDVIAGRAFVDIADFHFRVPVKEGIGLSIFDVGLVVVIGEEFVGE